MPHVIALDQGTTSSRAIVFDADGKIVAVAQREFEQHFPRPGWVEHDAEEIWKSQSETAAEAVASAGLKPSDLAGIGITNQRETTVVWDRATGKPISNAIVWQDRRTANVCDKLRADGAEALVQKKTGLVLDPYFSGTKLAWILDNVDGARARAEAGELAFGTIDTWLVSRLTGGAVHVTDPSNASRTMLFNIHTGEWDDELLALLKVPRPMLPEVRSSSEVYAEASEVLPGVPIAGIAGDQQSALFGQLCLEQGMGKNTYGTGCFFLMNTGTEAVTSRNNLLTTVAWKRNDEVTYALEGSVFVGGAVVQWLRDGLGLIESSEDVEALALTEKDSGDVFLVPAFAGLGAPEWDAYARGALIGITRGTTKGHLARAALEGIAYQVADLVSALEADAGFKLDELRVDGGASANDTLMQFQADILGVSLIRPRMTETTAMGAAFLAGLATGVWSHTSDLTSLWAMDRRFEPAMPESEARARRERWHQAVARCRDWAPHES